MDFKVVVDTLASLAALIAIISVLIGWYSSTRKPLSISKVVVHKKDSGAKFILFMQNRKDYPIKINRINGYSKKIFEVTQRADENPQYAELLSSDYAVFLAKHQFEVPAKGNVAMPLEVTGEVEIPNRLVFSMDTTHGYHELVCTNINIVEIDKIEFYTIVFKKEYNSKLPAKATYYWKRVSELIRRCRRRLHRV